MPEWAKTALRQGWTPNENFRFEDYENGERLAEEYFRPPPVVLRIPDLQMQPTPSAVDKVEEEDGEP
jgi:hypothetical protein